MFVWSFKIFSISGEQTFILERQVCVYFSPKFRRHKQLLHQNCFEWYNSTSEAAWLGNFKNFFFCNGSSGKHKHGAYSLLQNLTLLLIQIQILCAGAQLITLITSASGQTNETIHKCHNCNTHKHLSAELRRKISRVNRKWWLSKLKSSWTRHQVQTSRKRLLVLSMGTQGHTFIKKKSSITSPGS